MFFHFRISSLIISSIFLTLLQWEASAQEPRIYYPPTSDFYEYGAFVSAIEDVNGDNLSDIVVSRIGDQTNFLGGVQIISGADGSLIRELSVANSATMFRIFAPHQVISDQTGDSIDDVLIGAQGDNGTEIGEGRVYLLNTATGALIHEFISPDPQAGAGLSYPTLIRDLNGDNAPEILMVEPSYSSVTHAQVGRAQIFSGAAPYTHLQTINAPNPSERQRFGGYALQLPDVNNDTTPDLLIGSIYSVPLQAAGKVEVLSGVDYSLLYTIESTTPTQGNFFGRGALLVQDSDNDGIQDLLIDDSSNDVVKIYSSANGSEILTVHSPTLEGGLLFGRAMARVPDMNGDATSETLILEVFNDKQILVHFYSDLSQPPFMTTRTPEPSYGGRAIGSESLTIVDDLSGDGEFDIVVAPAGSGEKLLYVFTGSAHPVISAEDPIRFGSVHIDNTPASAGVIQVNNSGFREALDMDQLLIELTGPNAHEFEIRGGQPSGMLPPTETYNIIIDIVPDDTGPKSATVEVSYAGGDPQTFDLLGNVAPLNLGAASAFYARSDKIIYIDPVTRDRLIFAETDSMLITAMQDESPTTFLVAAGNDSFSIDRPRKILRVHKQTGIVEVVYDSVEQGFLTHVSGTEYLGIEPGGTVLAKLQYDGILRWDPVAETITLFNGIRPRSPYVGDMEVTSDGLVYYCIQPVSINNAQGLFFIHPETKAVTEIGTELPISRFEFNTEGQIIALTLGNGIVQIDPLTSNTITLAPDTDDYEMLDIDVTQDGRIFVSLLDDSTTDTSKRQQLFEYFPETEDFQLYSGIIDDDASLGTGIDFRGANFIVSDPYLLTPVLNWNYE